MGSSADHYCRLLRDVIVSFGLIIVAFYERFARGSNFHVLHVPRRYRTCAYINSTADEGKHVSMLSV